VAPTPLRPYGDAYRQRIQKAWGHAAHRGRARLLLNRARDITIHGPAHRGANGAAMPTDEDDQDDQFFFNHPESRCQGARSCCYCCLDPTPPTEEGEGIQTPGHDFENEN